MTATRRGFLASIVLMCTGVRVREGLVVDVRDFGTQLYGVVFSHERGVATALVPKLFRTGTSNGDRRRRQGGRIRGVAQGPADIEWINLRTPDGY